MLLQTNKFVEFNKEILLFTCTNCTNLLYFQLLQPKFGISIEEVSGTRLEINHTGASNLKWIFRTTVKVRLIVTVHIIHYLSSLLKCDQQQGTVYHIKCDFLKNNEQF